MAHTIAPIGNERAAHTSTLTPAAPGPDTPATGTALHSAVPDGAGV
ncbi:hypothetical protein [Micromonospora aurantiaca (nom. illeg.)]